jgi:hypothetical protein
MPPYPSREPIAERTLANCPSCSSNVRRASSSAMAYRPGASMPPDESIYTLPSHVNLIPQTSVLRSLARLRDRGTPRPHPFSRDSAQHSSHVTHGETRTATPRCGGACQHVAGPVARWPPWAAQRTHSAAGGERARTHLATWVSRGVPPRLSKLIRFDTRQRTSVGRGRHHVVGRLSCGGVPWLGSGEA